jgi:hypothetical protein
MSMSTVFVLVPSKGRPREIARDARDPLENQADIERTADAYSRGARMVRVYPDGLYVTPWRQAKEPLYETYDGQATLEFR